MQRTDILRNSVSRFWRTFKTNCEHSLKWFSYAFKIVFVALLLSLAYYRRSNFHFAHLQTGASTVEDYELELAVSDQVRTVVVSLKRHRATSSSRKNKVILLWTEYFGDAYSPRDYYFFPHEGSDYFERFACAFKECFVTNNRTVLDDVDAILFHGEDIIDYPKHFRENQIKILYDLEAPPTTFTKWYLKRNYFNWTMSYRSDSDVVVRYGKFISQDTGRNKQDYLRNKAKGAIWLCSHCGTSSKRENYVKVLRRYYPVDIYGSCGDKVCKPRMSSRCYDELLNKYKFYLSFENCICNDYVTEKFFNALKYDIIPVVMGGANYTEIAPKQSYIDATAFPNPKDLAAYLHMLANNATMYNGFFAWKRGASVHLDPWMCSLCEKLHNQGTAKRVLENPEEWYVNQASCKRWSFHRRFHQL